MRRILYHRSTAWVILFTSLAVTFVGWWVSNGYAQRRAEERFTYVSNEAQNLIRKRMLEYEQVLRGAAGLLNSSETVTRQEWRRYVATLTVEDYYPGIQGIAFIRQLKSADVAGFEASMRDQGFPDFAISPAGERPVYGVVEFIEPFDERNQRAFGYDLFSHPARRAAMERARDTGDPAMSAKVTLVQETDTDVQPGVLTFFPLYHVDQPLATVPQRREALIGYAYAPFRVHDLMRGILDHTRREVDVQVYDGPVVTPDGFLHDTTFPSASVAPPPTATTFRKQQVILISGHPWTLVISSTPQFDEAITTYQPALIAGAGVAIDLLLFLVITALSINYQRQSVRADTATSKLLATSKFNEALLNNAGAAIIAADVEGVITSFNPTAERLLGYTRAEAIGKLTPAVFHDRMEVIQRAHQFSRELGYPVEPGFRTFVIKADLGLPNTYEWTYLTKDGRRVAVLLSVTAIRDHSGTITSYLGIATDNSELHLAQRQLADSLAHLRSLNEALDEHAIVAFTDSQGVITEVNQKFCDISGYTREEIIGQTHRLISSGYHDREFYRSMWQTIGQGRIWHGIFRNRAKDGQHYWVDSTIVPILNDEGKPRQFIAVRTDITAHLRNVRLLDESQQLAKVGGWEYIVPLNRVYWTAEACRIHGIDTREAVPLERKLALYHPDDRKRVQTAIDLAISQGESLDLELRMWNGREHGRWLRVTGRPENTPRGTYSIIGSVQDIDDFKRAQHALQTSEQRMRALAAALPVGVYEINLAGDCIYTNAAWQRMAGLSGEDALGHGWDRAVHPDDLALLHATWEAAIQANRPFEHDFRYQHPDGTVRWVRSAATTLKINGSFAGYVGVNEDITEQREHVEKISASLAEKEVLLREVHHRVKNNLQLVTSLLKLQAGGLTDEANRAQFQECERRVRTMALVHEMLYAHTSLARIEIDVYIRQLGQSIVRSFRTDQDDIRLDLDIASIALVPDLTIPLGLILNELFTNACKYGHQRGRPLTIRVCLQKSAEGQELELTFEDDGPGFPADFDADTTSSLGYRLIKLLSKQIRAQLRVPLPNQPARYYLKLPL